MNPQIQKEVEAAVKELKALLTNPNKIDKADKEACRIVARTARTAIKRILEIYTTYLPAANSNPSPMFDSMTSILVEIEEYLHSLHN